MLSQQNIKNFMILRQTYLHTIAKVTEEETNLKQAKLRTQHANEAQRIVQQIAAQVQQLAHSQIAKVVTRCLKTVFQEDAFEFRIKFERRRGKTEAELLFVDRDGYELPSGEGVPGGVIDVAAFALRLACLMLSRPKKRLLLVADEPFKNVNGKVYQDRVGSLLLQLSEELGIQFIIVTDDPWLYIGKVIELGS